jgi:uncharacterized membrane protein SpoIIM required for sporulation
MPSVRFRQEREQLWRELEVLVVQVQHSGLSALSPEQLARLPVLYRALLSSLSVARAIALDAALLVYLEALAAQAHVVLYGSREAFPTALARFWKRTFPRTVRELRWHAAAALLVLVLGGLTASHELDRDPSRFDELVPPAYAQGRGPDSTTQELRDVLGAKETARATLVRFSSFLFTHNAGLGLLSLAVGFAAGVPVAYLLLTNGLTLGAFAWLYGSRGLGVEFWGWLLPHGVTEMGALVLCSAGGLFIGHALVFPGRRSRLESLRRAGSTAGVIAVGAVAMFLVAGLVEGVFRQTVSNPTAHWAVAIGSTVAWACYFLLAGRKA